MSATASAVAPATASAVLPLHGPWRRSIDGVAIDEVVVPGGYAPVGECELAYEVELPREWRQAERVFLVTEGVLASADFALNGQPLGRAGAWSRYRFEIPRTALRERNVVSAGVRDLAEDFGPAPGRRWEAGLFRPIRLERRPSTFIADAHLRYQLLDDRAECVVAVSLDGNEALSAMVTLRERGGPVVAIAHAEAGAPARLSLERPRRWSPTAPNLYELSVTLPNGDAWSDLVGFRTIEVRGPDFFLNGERLLLKGICRHEFIEGFGYAAPEAAARRELEAIRHAGFNYVRLVHSPQAPWVPRIAAELGLLVSEEPGTCWHDLGDEVVAAPAMEALSRTVRRDRNLPSVLAWYLYNECEPNVAYAKRAAALCRELDPGRLLAMADSSGKHELVKEMVAAAALSYVGLNVYSINPLDYRARMEAFAGVPVVFTEWGAGIWSNNDSGLRSLCAEFVRAAAVDSPFRIAGFSYWCWADYEEYSRDEPCAVAGWTIQGVVDRHGQPKAEMAWVQQLCFELDHPPARPEPVVERLLPEGQPGAWRPVALDAVGGDQAALEAAVAATRRKHRSDFPRLGRVRMDGIDFACRGGDAPARPLLIGASRTELVIPIDAEARGIAVLGHTAFTAAYPCSTVGSVYHADAEPRRRRGDSAGEYTLVFADGEEVVPLRHGLEVLRSNDICRWWTLAPRAPGTRPALRATLHPSYEVLRVDLWRREWARPRRLRALRWRALDAEAVQPLYALSVLT